MSVVIKHVCYLKAFFFNSLFRFCLNCYFNQGIHICVRVCVSLIMASIKQTICTSLKHNNYCFLCHSKAYNKLNMQSVWKKEQLNITLIIVFFAISLWMFTNSMNLSWRGTNRSFKHNARMLCILIYPWHFYCHLFITSQATIHICM